MRKTIIFLLFSGLCCLMAGESPIKGSRLSDDVLILHGGGANVTVIRTNAGLVVVDSFDSPRSALDARKQIDSHFPGLPVKYLINTNFHIDHVGGNQSFPDAVIIGHQRIEDRILEEHKEMVKKYGIDNPKIKGYYPTPPTLQISGNILVKLGGKHLIFFTMALLILIRTWLSWTMRTGC